MSRLIADTIIILLFMPVFWNWGAIAGGELAHAADADSSWIDSFIPFIDDTSDYNAEESSSLSRTENLSTPVQKEDPGKVVDRLAARANDWHEPSRRSEERYVQAIRKWLDSLQPGKREQARQILREAHPSLRDLRIAIREKKSQLATLTFDQDTSPEALPRLGQELQDLRNALRGKLQGLADRLRDELDVSMGPLGGDGFWLAPPIENPSIMPNAHPRIIPSPQRDKSSGEISPDSSLALLPMAESSTLP